MVTGFHRAFCSTDSRRADKHSIRRSSVCSNASPPFISNREYREPPSGDVGAGGDFPNSPVNLEHIFGLECEMIVSLEIRGWGGTEYCALGRWFVLGYSTSSTWAVSSGGGAPAS